jgi:hypothetical protein
VRVAQRVLPVDALPELVRDFAFAPLDARPARQPA